MTRAKSRLFPGDVVEVKSADEILSTLDADGALGKLPFMPEMMEYCSKQFRVSRHVVKICTSGAGFSLRVFPADDVVFLEELRCSGAQHDGCQKACMIFWREAWLRKVDAGAEISQGSPDDAGAMHQLRARLKTKSGPTTYFCQASELLKCSEHLSKRQRFTNCIGELRSRNCGFLQLAKQIAVWLFWRFRRMFLGVYACGTNSATPVGKLGLQPGELVEVKPMDSIVGTLNPLAQNRGLWFSPNMRLYCGKQKKVERRIENIIVDGTGEMRRLHNTVYLEGSMCGCAHVAFGGCSRSEFVYWSEIWLKRAGADARMDAPCGDATDETPAEASVNSR